MSNTAPKSPDVSRWLPALGWLRTYDQAWLRGDVVAGITLAAYLLPAGLGDASLANLPPQAGLYACLFGGLVFCLPDAESAFYFSGVTYATIGYGDLVLPEPWRMLGPIEGLTGILMCGLSTGIFFAMINRILLSRPQAKQK